MIQVVDEMTTVTVASRKGGTGKTTTTHGIARALAARRRRVLVIDIDDQAAITHTLTGGTAGADVPTLADVLGKRPSMTLADVVVATLVEGVSLVPASESLAALELELAAMSLGRESRLRESIATLAGSYDAVIIDTPPSLGLLSVSALVAADIVLPVTAPSGYSARMTGALLDSIEQVRAYLRPDLRVPGVLLSMVDPRDPIAADRAAEIRAALAEEPGMLPVEIPRWRTISRSTETGTGLADSGLPSARRAAELYDRLAQLLVPSIIEEMPDA